MPSHRFLRHTGLVLKIASIALAAAVAAGAVYATDALPDRARNIGTAPAAVPEKVLRLAVVETNEAWAADESAAGTRPDAAH